MKKIWKPIALISLALVAACLWLDICYGTFTGARCRLPVLMYHHFVEEDKEDLLGTIVSQERFREQMEALKEAGFEAVHLAQVIDFVENGTALPDKPVLITMDDGYTSNLEIAAPILEELGMCATVFVIGINEGEEAYVHDGQPFWQARFAYEEAAPWVEKGVIEIQSHTYDMHQLASYGFSGREGMLQMEGEPDADYILALREDLRLTRERREGRISTDLVALAYPFGYWSEQADQTLQTEGILMTFTIDEYCNTLYTGNWDTLRKMGRFNVTNTMSGEGLADRLNLVAR